MRKMKLLLGMFVLIFSGVYRFYKYRKNKFEYKPQNMQEINPKNFTVAYGFSKDECHKKASGKCSLDKVFNHTKSKKILKIRLRRHIAKEFI